MQTIMIVEDDPDIRDGVRIALNTGRRGGNPIIVKTD